MTIEKENNVLVEIDQKKSIKPIKPFVVMDFLLTVEDMHLLLHMRVINI